MGDWIATLCGGPYDGHRLEVETIWPRLRIFPTLEVREVTEYHRVAYDSDQETVDYLIVPDEEGGDPLANP